MMMKCMRWWSSPSEVDGSDAPAQIRRGEVVPGGRRWRVTRGPREHAVGELGDGVEREDKGGALSSGGLQKRGMQWVASW
jgi:hypothetical protein